jgi:hypothetical protein
MKEEFVSFETAKLAKEKGFNLKCGVRYDEENTLTTTKLGMNSYPNNFVNSYAAPTQSLLQKWLRETHNIYVEIFTAKYAWNSKVGFYYHVRTIKSKHDDSYHNYRTKFVGTYEEALERGLELALNCIKNK